MSEKNSKKKFDLKEAFQNYKKYFIGIGALLFLILVVYFGGVIYHNNHFMTNTKINNIDVSGLTEKEAIQKIKNKIEKNNSLVLTFSDGSTQTLNSNQGGLSYNEQANLKSVLKKQNSFLWFSGYFSSKKYTVENMLDIKEDVLLNSLNSLSQLQAANQTAASDAYIKYADNKFTIIEETEGTQINIDKLLQAVKEAFLSGESGLNVKKSGSYIEAAIKSSDKSLQAKLKAANEYAIAAITYTTPSGKKIILDGDTIITWLTQDANGNWIRDDNTFKSKALAFVKNLANSYNTQGGTRTFVGHDGNSHTITGGTYGIRIKPQAETTALLEDIYANKVTSRTPITTGASVSSSNGGIGDTYVEVSLSAQYMWYVKNGQVVLETAIVSGLATDPTRATPTGAYYIYFKQLDRVLRGTKLPDGTYPYETPVKYWMAFNGGIGFHDAPWQPYFGGTRYLTNGSHGCINMPSDMAGKLYNILEYNTPVVVY